MPDFAAARLRAPVRHSRFVSILFALIALVAVAPVAQAETPPWRDLEATYLEMLNCTRTGGRVLDDGTCDGYGSGEFSAYRKPLRRSSAISNKVSRPYAMVIVEAGVCSHTFGSELAQRLHRAGFHPTTYGENIGCASGRGSAWDLILRTHLMFQDEQGRRAADSWHWKNMKNRRFREVGIGIWRVGDRTYLVTDYVSA